MRQRIQDELKAAMKAGDKRKTATLRLINCAINDRDIAHRADDGERCCEGDITAILAKMIKQREESARIYEENSRIELAQRERAEMDIIREFLPQPLSDDEMRSACREAVEQVEGSGLRDMGRVMATIKERYLGRLDMSRASAEVRALLQ